MSSAYVPADLRHRVSVQARFRCGYCLSQEKITGAAMEIEHLFPRARGGLTLEENLWLACSFCNEYKGDRVTWLDPENGRSVRLFNPRFQVWAEHFEWDETSTMVLGTTAIGRATVEALKLNRPLLVRARKFWVDAGWHPPRD